MVILGLLGLFGLLGLLGPPSHNTTHRALVRLALAFVSISCLAHTVELLQCNMLLLSKHPLA
jgi:hypothetical protein